MRPDFSFEYTGSFPDGIKIKKKFQFWPVELNLGGTWNLETGEFSHKATCKDVYVGGKLSYTAADNVVEYRKRFPVPYVSKHLAFFTAAARWNLKSRYDAWKPRLRIGFELRQGTAELVRANAISFRKRIWLHRFIGIEACNQLQFDLPGALSLSVPDANTHTVGEDDKVKVKWELQQLNVVLRV